MDFARFLALWMADFNQTEASFWKTTNPARLWSIFTAYYRPETRRSRTESLQTGENRPKTSLSEYLMGGG